MLSVYADTTNLITRMVSRVRFLIVKTSIIGEKEVIDVTGILSQQYYQHHFDTE